MAGIQVTNTFETCIIGQGLAGTTLAWALHQQGNRIALIDPVSSVTSSKIAAGLITPVTGMRFVKSWQYDEFWPVAKKFYRTIEQKTNTDFLNEKSSLRFFTSPEEIELFSQKSVEQFPELVKEFQNQSESRFLHPFGGFEMTTAARLNVPAYLDASRKHFQEQSCFYEAELNLPDDIKIEKESIRIPSLEISAQRIIFCQGFSGAGNPWFETVPFDAAKGEILTVRILGLNEKHVLHKGIWLAPLGDDLYRLGATYDREHLNLTPTEIGKEELCNKLAELISLPFEVVDYQAAVRPIILGRKPKIGFHPEFPRLGYFNGLGSKGSLQAPWFAELFASMMAGSSTIPEEFDVAEYFKHQNSSRDHS